MTNTRRLRIAFFGARGVPHTYGGYETFLLEITPRLVERGHQVTVYNHSSLFPTKAPSYKGVRLIYVPTIETKSLATPIHSLLSAIDVAFRKVDIVIAVNVANVVQLLIPRIAGKHVACNVDGLDWKRGKWGPIAKSWFYTSARLAGRICPGGIITDAMEMHRLYLEEFGTPSACIAYGANLERSRNPEIVREYGLEPGQYYLIASRMVPENNPDLIVKAFQRANTRRVLAIAGNANYRSPFLDEMRRTAGSRVKWLGHISSVEHVKELHCNCYAYLHGHMLGGTNPALLKSLGFGNMVLALNTRFNQEVLKDYGILFERDIDDLANKLNFIDANPGLAAEYRRRAPERIRHAYTWDKIADQYEEFFLQLASGENPGLNHSTVSLTHSHAQGLASVAEVGD